MIDNKKKDCCFHNVRFSVRKAFRRKSMEQKHEAIPINSEIFISLKVIRYLYLLF